MGRIRVYGINFSPEISGNAPYTTGLCRALAADGWDVGVVTGYPHYPEWTRRGADRAGTLDGVSFRRFSHYVPRNPTTLRRGILELSWFVSALPDLVRRQDVDVVLGVVPSLSGAALALLAARRNHVPFIMWMQDAMGAAATESGIRGGRLAARIVCRAESFLAKRADRVLIVAESFRTYLSTAGVDSSKIARARNWASIPRPSESQDDVRRRWDLSSSQALVVHSGNIGAKQRLGVLVAAAADLPKVQFVLQGDGHDRASIQALASRTGVENLRFIGSLSSQDLSNLLSAADLLVLVQRESVATMSLPSKLHNYQASGVPIVASVAQASETALVLRPLHNAYLASDTSASSLASAIRAALNTDHDVADESPSPAQDERRIATTAIQRLVAEIQGVVTHSSSSHAG